LPIDADVAIVGAGPAGSTLAIMLKQAGIRTIALDRARFPRDKPCGEGLMPAGVEVLEGLGLSLSAFPSLRGVTYRVPTGGSARGEFRDGRTGRGVRRIAFDKVLAERAGATFNVEATGLSRRDGHLVLETSFGDISARAVVGADGIHSRVARWVGWSRPPRAPYRYALVGHVEAPAHGVDRVTVTLGQGCEVYSAPTSVDELLVAVLGSKTGLRRDGERARDAYARHLASAHPELSVTRGSEVHGAGPFWVRPSAVAGDHVFLLGDAAGFLDPLTGDGMSDALVAARTLAGLFASGAAGAEAAYTRWERKQWRRRLFVNRLALTLTGSSALARRALRGLQRSPSTLNRLLEVNDGSRGISSLSLRDWSALVGV
jgi:flavin-dependent dehydrogenase